MTPRCRPHAAHKASPPDPARRRWLQASGPLALAGTLPRAFAATRPVDPEAPRLVLIVLRGGLDGLMAAPVPGDPAYAPARGPLAGFGAPTLPLEGPYALHPSLAQMHALYAAGELAVVHATGLPYRDRSHFDAQQLLESGGTRPHALATGWLGRALDALDARGNGARGIAIETAVPLVLRGAPAIDSWAPSALPEPDGDLVGRLAALYAGDAELGRALARARSLHAGAGAPGASGARQSAADARARIATLARAAGRFVQAGAQVAVFELDGWDSHANQAGYRARLVLLDAAFGELRGALGSAWPRTVVVAATEFGRTVAINGTAGTDHGTASAAFVAGGAVRGGRVLADWPGLAPAQRHEGRDLRTTTDLRAVFRVVLADHLRVPRSALDASVLPGSATLPALSLLRG